MQASPELHDELFADKVRQARAMSLSDRVMAGPALFDYACEIARAGIRAAMPGADDAAVQRELKRRLEIQRRLENAA